jgi:hypothetical protein
VLKKDNLVRQNYSGNKFCVFCSHLEMIQHLFLIVTLPSFL